ncbi:MAG: two-component system response regulator [Bacteroidetes bacterium]|nr:two-component system response regulator [Bacteroidota bacterium]
MDTEIEILLVEDDISDAEMAIRALKKQRIGNHIVHLKDGAEAIDFIFATGNYENRNANNKPKMILLDLKMPKVSGIEVLKTLKSDERSRSIPVVVLTSSAEDPDIRTCYELGVNSYIIKPVGFENFSAAVAKLGMYWLLLNNPYINNK